MSTIRTPKRPPKPTKAPSGSPFATDVTIADLLKRLGNIPANRVRLHPTPGTATEKDLLEILDRENRPCELVEGTLVEKPMGFEESEIAGTISHSIGSIRRGLANWGSSPAPTVPSSSLPDWFASPTLPLPPGIASQTASGPRRRFLRSLPIWPLKS